MHFLFSLLLAFNGFSASHHDHDIHVSVTDIEITADGQVEVVIKIFLDDLMQSMGLELGAELPENYTNSDDLINKFLGDNLEVKINDQVIDYELEDTTPSSPAIWITLIGKAPAEVKTIEIDNKILIKQFDDQSNMVNISFGEERYSELLDGENTKYTLTVGE